MVEFFVFFTLSASLSILYMCYLFLREHE